MLDTKTTGALVMRAPYQNERSRIMRMKMLRNTIVEGEIKMAGEIVNIPEKHVAMLKHAGKAEPLGESKKPKAPKPETATVEPGEQAVSQRESSRRSGSQEE
jgi:hypothetical protein